MKIGEAGADQFKLSKLEVYTLGMAYVSVSVLLVVLFTTIALAYR